MSNDYIMSRFSEEVHAIYRVWNIDTPETYVFLALPVMAWDGQFACVSPPGCGHFFRASEDDACHYVAGKGCTAEFVAIDRLTRWERCPRLIPPYRWATYDPSASGTYDPAKHDRHP